MADTRTVHTEDVVPVGTRVSWAAIFAGAVMALAIQAVLALLGGAIGLSLSDEITAETFGTTAAIWVVASLVISLLIGGYITSQCTVGENHGEAVIHGVIMWGVTLAIMVWLTAAGVRAGFNGVMSVASVGAGTMQSSNQGWEELARKAGATDADLANIRNRTSNAAASAQDPQYIEATKEQAAKTAMNASWITLFTVMLSMAAAALGAYFGAGTRLRLVGVGTQSRPIGAAVVRT